MERLLRLDPSVVSEPRIAQYLHEARVNGKKATFELIAEALKRGPRAKVTLKRVSGLQDCWADFSDLYWFWA